METVKKRKKLCIFEKIFAKITMLCYSHGRKEMDLMAKYNASDIAKWFLNHNNIAVAEDGAELISNLKLQKLLYYAQGGYLGIKGKKLFDDNIYAWKHGPVVPSIYHEYKIFSDTGIELDENFITPEIDDETVNILEQVYEVFGQYSAWKLREMTHNEDPWKLTEQSEIILPELIAKYFLENYISDDE